MSLKGYKTRDQCSKTQLYVYSLASKLEVASTNMKYLEINVTKDVKEICMLKTTEILLIETKVLNK